MTEPTIYKTPQGHNWRCNDIECQKERDKWEIVDDSDLEHCGTTGCHTVVWTEKGERCGGCERWFCMYCWQNSGKRIYDDYDVDDPADTIYLGDSLWYCDSCLSDS